MHVEHDADQPGNQLQVNLRTLAEVRAATLGLRDDMTTVKTVAQQLRDQLDPPAAPSIAEDSAP